jgi:hypothetical protein
MLWTLLVMLTLVERYDFLSPYLLPELPMESSSLDIQQIKAVEKKRACVCIIDHWEVLEENLIP